MTARSDRFPTDPAGLPEARPPESIELADGDRFDLRIAPVAKRLGGPTLRMLAYNGSIPGPTLRVRQGSKLAVRVVNDGDLEATVHWHGLRLDNRSDGTHETQRPMPVGGSFTYHLLFPDPGVYWYHPHIREDYGQELGLYGNIVVAPSERDYWPPVHREIALTLDDILIEEGKVAPFRRSTSTHTTMGRFGNAWLVNGEPELSLAARRGEVVRLYLTNTANTRFFNLGLRGARMKLVGGDSGHFEREEFVEEVLLTPSERVVVDVRFDEPGSCALEHRSPEGAQRLATVAVSGERAEPSLAEAFERLRAHADMAAERARIASHLGADPDRTLALVAEMRGDAHGGAGHAHKAGGVEWEDDMEAANRMSTPSTMRWKLIDRATGAEGRAIDWRFRVGDRVKIRIVNEMDSDHPMPHPFHVHGAGRLLTLSRNGVAERNLVWKDTVLVWTGETVDVLLDVTNPGRWMAHCHIAEHHEGGMVFSFDVNP